MGVRNKARSVVGELVSFGQLVKSLASGTLSILEHSSDSSSDECEWYGTPAVLCRPPSGADVLFVDLDGERVVLGVRESRWQVSLEQGECVLRALGAGAPAYIKLKPGGEVEVHGTSIKLGGEAATVGVALDSLVRASITAAIATHTHVCAAPGNQSAVGVPTAPPPSTASTVTKSL
jgi:hypothetical protein